MVRCGSKNKHQNDNVCLKVIELHAQNTLTILGFVVNIIGGMYILLTN